MVPNVFSEKTGVADGTVEWTTKIRLARVIDDTCRVGWVGGWKKSRVAAWGKIKI
jgi:hypothetical protein